jgi:uncharacterized protein YcbX
LYDREWALVDSSGAALTQKKLPRLATIRPMLDLNAGMPLPMLATETCSFLQKSVEMKIDGCRWPFNTWPRHCFDIFLVGRLRCLNVVFAL